MKRWRFDILLLIALLSTCLVIVSANDEDEDDDGVTIESEKVVMVAIKFDEKMMILIIEIFSRNIQSQHMKQ